MISFKLGGVQMPGSPLQFLCAPGAPDAQQSTLLVPDDPMPLHANTPYKLVVVGTDKFGNATTRGGAFVRGRLVAAGTPLPASQEPNLEAEDLGTGTYELTMQLCASAQPAWAQGQSRRKLPSAR